jgi:hypothetical protein
MKRLIALLRPQAERSPDHDFAFCPLFSLRLRGLI